MICSNTTAEYNDYIVRALTTCGVEKALSDKKIHTGKVRDTYELGEHLLLVTTNRQSAFDRQIASVPFKGEVLNLTSAWWFEKTAHLVPNHLVSLPARNQMLVKKCRVFPVEFVVRGYITGSTNTALWMQYQSGVREYCGLRFPEGLKKNQRLAQPILTPTTKDAKHDEPISAKDVVARGLMTQSEWDCASEYAMRLFAFGQAEALKRGLILVDTKYEFGVDDSGRMLLIDEVHTPDSSRYWLSETYAERVAAALEPDNFDKEFLRLWFVAHCDPYRDAILPKAPDELIVTLASRYIYLYEQLTGKRFDFLGT